MRRVTIAVIGNAKTTRANVEALISDVVDSVDEATIVSVFDQAPSEGILWAEQWAVDKGIPVLKYPGNDYETLLKENPAEDLKFFMLWDDEDPECQLAASRAQEARILAYDLTDGLILIPLNSEPISRPQEPKIPIAETVTVTPSEPAVTIKAAPDIEVAEEDYEEDIDNVDYDSEYDLEENLVVLVSEMGKIFARSFAKEFKKIIKD
jgi:hypothetical protein